MTSASETVDALDFDFAGLDIMGFWEGVERGKCDAVGGRLSETGVVFQGDSGGLKWVCDGCAGKGGILQMDDAVACWSLHCRYSLICVVE